MNKILTFLVLILVILFPSCQVTEKITLSEDGNTSESNIQVYDFFLAVLNDFSAFLTEETSVDSIMDNAVRDFANGLSSNPNNSNVFYTRGESGEYMVSFDFESISNALSTLSGGRETTILKEDGNSISFYLDINNYPELKEMIPFLSDPNFEVYGPEYNQGMSETDYLDMIYYLLGEEAPDAIRNSLISIDITVPGKFTATEGVTVTSSNTCTYSFHLIDFLLLASPMSFSISWN